MAERLIASAESIALAAEAIRSGQLVAFGTETVYGLGADATNDKAVATIFEAKGRPRFNPLISHVPSVDDVFHHGVETPLARLLATSFWPGPMTLVLGRNSHCPVSPLALADLDSIALRVPANEKARHFLEACGTPVAAPSANKSGRISPSRASHVSDDLGSSKHLALILDTGPSQAGIESTVIDARGKNPVILRPGSITSDMIMTATGLVSSQAGDGILSPGQMKSHYAPDLPLHLNAEAADDKTAWIGFGPSPTPPALCDFNLSPEGDLIEAAAMLYHHLRAADQSGAKAIAVAPIPEEGIGMAINDRLNRAACRN